MQLLPFLETIFKKVSIRKPSSKAHIWAATEEWTTLMLRFLDKLWTQLFFC